MAESPLSPRVVLLSWGVALALWPFAWWLQAAAQGVGVLLAGGGWVGVAVPLGAAPWGLVNEPGIAFAISRQALFGYWLPGPLLAALLAVLLPPLAPGSRRVTGELILLHASLASAVLGLAWAPALGGGDGTAAGLARFWHVDAALFVLACLAVAVVALQYAVVRLTEPLWVLPGGPLRRRRLLAVLLHVAVPLAGWAGAAHASGWRVPPLAVATAATALLAAFVAAWLWVPRHPLRPRAAPAWPTVIGVLLGGTVIAATAAWAGQPYAGGAKALLWGSPAATSNVRQGMTEVRLRP